MAGNPGIHFLPEGVIFRGTRPRRQILRRTAGPCRYVVRHMTGARCESGRSKHECNQASHYRTDSMRQRLPSCLSAPTRATIGCRQYSSATGASPSIPPTIWHSIVAVAARIAAVVVLQRGRTAVLITQPLGVGGLFQLCQAFGVRACHCKSLEVCRGSARDHN